MVLLCRWLSVAIVVQSISRCLAVVFAMAMRLTAEVASATAEKVFTAHIIREHAAMLQPPQPFERPNEALKHYRDRFEISFIPTESQYILDLEPGFLLIRKVTKGQGEEFHFEAGAAAVAFSWSQMLLATGQQFERVVGVGVVAVLMFVRPNSYDHHRAHSFVKQHGYTPENRPPVWDFLVRRADGTAILLHPRWRRKGGIDILPFEDMPDAVSPVPSAGVGKSDGKGTYRRTKNAAYASKAKEPPVVIQLPATAGLTPFLQPNDTDVHQPLRAAAAAAAAVQGAVLLPPMPQRVPPGAPAAAAGQGVVPPPPPPSHEAPPISLCGPVLPPAAVSATAEDIDARSATSWHDVELDF
jgi:hypothetical protein